MYSHVHRTLSRVVQEGTASGSCSLPVGVLQPNLALKTRRCWGLLGVLKVGPNGRPVHRSFLPTRALSLALSLAPSSLQAPGAPGAPSGSSALGVSLCLPSLASAARLRPRPIDYYCLLVSILLTFSLHFPPSPTANQPTNTRTLRRARRLPTLSFLHFCARPVGCF